MRQRSLNLRSKEACNSRCTTLIKSITKIVTELPMNNHGKTLHELTTHVLKKLTETDMYFRQKSVKSITKEKYNTC
jgi:hypothetical protein